MTQGAGASGLFVGIPDVTIVGGNNVNFFAADFFPTSGAAVFSPDLTGSPVGIVIVDFAQPTSGVGVIFLDAESATSSIEAFDGAGGTGSSLGKVDRTGFPDNSQEFGGIVAAGIKSTVISMGGGGDGVGLDDLCFVFQEVTIDIKPGSDPNCFNVNGKGVIPIAILGSATLDVNDINPLLLSFEGMLVRIRGNNGPQCSVQEVSGDAFDDLVCQFVDDPTQWVSGQSDATVTGELNDGTPFEGTDSICVENQNLDP